MILFAVLTPVSLTAVDSGEFTYSGPLIVRSPTEVRSNESKATPSTAMLSVPDAFDTAKPTVRCAYAAVGIRAACAEVNVQS